jgi:soluble cytochrome b562
LIGVRSQFGHAASRHCETNRCRASPGRTNGKREENTMRVARVWAALAAIVLAGSVWAVAPVRAAQDIIKHVRLTDQAIDGFIAAQKDMAAMAEKIQGAPPDKPDPKIQAELEAIAKKHGFKDFVDYDDTAANISMVMAGIDPQTGAYTDPVVAIKKEIEDVKKDAQIPEKDKAQMLKELDEALKSTPPLQFPENIEIVKKHRQKIEAVLQ